MRRTSSIPGSPGDWLTRAKADLALAKAPLPAGGLYEDLCFHAQQAVALNAYAHEFRYPGLAEPVTEHEYEAAVSLAEQVVRWAESLIQSRTP